MRTGQATREPWQGEAQVSEPASGRPTFDDLVMGAGPTLDELVDRAGLREMVDSFHHLFRIPVRIFSESTGLMAKAGNEPELFAYLSQFPAGKRIVYQTIEKVKSLKPSLDEQMGWDSFMGVSYLLSAIAFEGRRIGRIVLGPFLPVEVRSMEPEILSMEPGISSTTLAELAVSMPRAQPETVAHIARHLQCNLDLVLSSGHKALLTSRLHLVSVRESYHDLEERNRELQEAHARLQELDRLKSNFLATVSHELRTPLTSIIGYSEMLLEAMAGALTTEQREFVRIIHEKGGQLLELISALLDLSRLETGALALSRVEVTLSDLVSDVLLTVTPLALKRNVRIVDILEPDLPKLMGDPVRLRQVLLNLVDNALKFTPEGGAISIEVQTCTMGADSDEDDGMALWSEQRRAARVRVTDSGSGILDRDKARVFDAFYQVGSDPPQPAGGVGLGLAIVKRLVEGHQGSIHIEDNLPQGSVFVVTLPFQGATSV